MASNKTRPTSQSVAAYLDAVSDARRREDAVALTAIMARATGTEPAMWGTSIVGFGTHHYVYESGREGDTAAVGFSVRAKAIVLYGLLEQPSGAAMAGVEALGPVELGKGCAYVKQLADIDLAGLEALVERCFAARANA